MHSTYKESLHHDRGCCSHAYSEVSPLLFSLSLALKKNPSPAFTQISPRGATGACLLFPWCPHPPLSPASFVLSLTTLLNSIKRFFLSLPETILSQEFTCNNTISLHWEGGEDTKSSLMASQQLQRMVWCLHFLLPVVPI